MKHKQLNFGYEFSHAEETQRHSLNLFKGLHINNSAAVLKGLLQSPSKHVDLLELTHNPSLLAALLKQRSPSNFKAVFLLVILSCEHDISVCRP